MHKHPFLTLLALNIAAVLLAPPSSWLAPLCTLLLAPLAVGILATRLFARQAVVGQVFRVVVVIGVGALLRPYWWATMTDRDFTFDSEPEIEFFLACCQFVVAGIAFLASRPLRTSAA